jgi:hypothetical protein
MSVIYVLVFFMALKVINDRIKSLNIQRHGSAF